MTISQTAAHAAVRAANLAGKQVVVTTTTGQTITGTARWQPGEPLHLVIFGIRDYPPPTYQIDSLGHHVDPTNYPTEAAAHSSHLPWRTPDEPAYAKATHSVHIANVALQVTSITQATADADTLGVITVTKVDTTGARQAWSEPVAAGTPGARAVADTFFGEPEYVLDHPAVEPAPVAVVQPDPNWRYGDGTD